MTSKEIFEFFTNTQGWQCWHYCQLCVPIYLEFSPLSTSTSVSKCKIRNQRAYEHYILRINATLDQLIFKNRVRTKLVILAFLCCGETVKNYNLLYLSNGLCERISVNEQE